MWYFVLILFFYICVTDAISVFMYLAQICPQNLDDDILQKIAMEMNLSETAFIKLIDKSDSFKESKFRLYGYPIFLIVGLWVSQ